MPADYFPFLTDPANLRNRTTFYHTLARLLFMEDTPAKFKSFVAPLQQAGWVCWCSLAVWLQQVDYLGNTPEVNKRTPVPTCRSAGRPVRLPTDMRRALSSPSHS